MKRPLLTLKKKPAAIPKEESLNTPFENLKASLKPLKEESVKEASPPPAPVKTERQKTEKKKKSSKTLHPILVKLCEKYPKLFNLTSRKPLKIGIEEDILQEMGTDPVITTQGLYYSLGYYIKGTAYQKGLSENDYRFDLQGEQAGLVSDVYSLEIAFQKEKKERPQFIPNPVITKLCEKYPNTFHGTKRKPLKIGIHKDILEALKDDEKVTATALRKALFWYIRGYAYQRGIVMHDHRFDLDGNPAGEITPEQKEAAQLQLDQKKHPVTRKTKEKRESTDTPKPDGTETPSPEGLEPDKKAESVL
jgi:sRNA-binding protein